MNLETLFMMLAGFLLGAVPAFLLIGVYFGRRVESDKKALQLKYERQITALRATLGRMMERIDILTGERNQLTRTNRGLREAIRDQHQISDSAGQDLEEAQQNLLRMEERVDELQAENLRYQGRVEQAGIQQQRMAAHTQKLLDQQMQTERLRRNLLFAATQLRETTVTNEALESRLNRQLDPLPADAGITPDQLDVGIIEGLEPVYAERLHDSGIHTIGDLARQTPARVAHFAGLPTWDDSAAWIAEAKIRLAANRGSTGAQPTD